MPVENDAEIEEILRSSAVVAVVGASQNPHRDSHQIMRFLMDRGYTVHPVNPKYPSVLGRTCYPDLASVPEQIDIVDIFRRSEAVPGIVADAIAAKVRTVWMQLGVIHEKAARDAEQNGLQVIMDHCNLVDHRRLIH